MNIELVQVFDDEKHTAGFFKLEARQNANLPAPPQIATQQLTLQLHGNGDSDEIIRFYPRQRHTLQTVDIAEVARFCQ